MTKTVVALVALAALAGCGGGNSDSADDGPCIVLADGGNKLCGGDAAAWCRATDADRHQSIDAVDAYDAMDEGPVQLRQSQYDCDALEARYPG